MNLTLPAIVLCLGFMAVGVVNGNLPLVLAGGFCLLSCMIWLLMATMIMLSDRNITAMLLERIQEEGEE